MCSVGIVTPEQQSMIENSRLTHSKQNTPPRTRGPRHYCGTRTSQPTPNRFETVFRVLSARLRFHDVEQSRNESAKDCRSLNTQEVERYQVWILVFTLSLVSDASTSSRKVAFVNLISLPSAKFFPSGCCSPIVSCHRQLNLYPKFLHTSHRENGSFDVLSSHLPSVTADRRQLRTIYL